MDLLTRMAARRTLVAAMAGLGLLLGAGTVTAREDGTPLRLVTSLSDSPVGGHLAIREVVVDGRSLGWRELVEYGGTLFAPKGLLDSLALKPRPRAFTVYTRFESWYALNAIPGLSVNYSFTQKRVSLGTGGLAAVPADAPAADAGLRLRSATELSRVPDAPATAAAATAAPAIAAAAATQPRTAPAAATPQAAATGRLLPLEVRVNGANAGNWLLLERGGTLYAPPDAFEEWRLSRDTSVPGIEFRGRTWYPLTSIPGYEAKFNFAEQSVDLRFLASAFGATRLSGQAEERVPLSPVLSSFFVNYDVSDTVSAGRSFETVNDLGALAELGYSGSIGLFTSSHVGRNLADDPALDSQSWRRLETRFTRDFPEHNLSLRLGDSATRPGAWGRQVYFGGVQIGRNFALSPGLITYPLPVLAGQSSSPSTVELYVNDVLRQTSQVPTGPFVIDNFPLLTGSGQARLVVRDLLGRETVLVQNFFTSTELLNEGLSDWSAELGAVRRNLGIENADYGQVFTSGLWRYGIDRQRTVEARAEVGEETQGGGLGLSFEMPWQMLGHVSAAGSENDVAGGGGHGVVSVQHASLQHGFSLRAEGATREYRQIGMENEILPIRRQWSASYTSFAREGRGSFGFGYASIERYDEPEIQTTSANYTLLIGARSSITFTASHVRGPAKATTVGAALVIPFDNRLSATANVTSGEEFTDAYAGVSQGLPAELGLGWRALAGRRAGANFGEGGLYYQGSRALLTADVNATKELQTGRFGAQGALIVADGSLFATRRLDANSFAVVEVEGYENVGVGFQSSVYTRTDADGRALVPNLQPYRRNSIRLDPNELPISAEIDSIEQVAVPAYRSGVKVKFPVRSGRGALIKIVLEDGAPAPAGAVVMLEGDSKEFYVARRGEAFVTGLQPSNVLKLSHDGQSCTLKVDLPPGTVDDIARVGPVTCAGVRR